MELTNQKNWIDRCEQIVMFLLLVLMADCAIFGAGRTLAIGGIGFRMMIVGALMAFAVPLMLRDFKKLISRRVLWILMAFAFWLVIQTVRGIRNGNSMSVMVSDLKGFMYFVVVIPVVCVLNSKQRLHTLMKVMMYASGALAVFALVSAFLYRFSNDFFERIYALDPQEYFVQLSTIVKGKVPRLFYKSTNYLLVACAFSVYFYVTGEKKGSWQYPVITGISLFALLISYTRASYLAAAVAVVAMVAMYMAFGNREKRTKFWKQVAISLLVFALVTGGLGAIVGTDYIKHGIDRVSSTFTVSDKKEETSVPGTEYTWNGVWRAYDPQNIRLAALTTAVSDSAQQAVNEAEHMTMLSDAVREKTLSETREYIRSGWLLGHGLGKALICREDGLSEYFYHDVIVKTGVIGLILYLLPVLWMVADLVRKQLMDREYKLLLGAWMAVLLGFMAFSYYNPYMNASLGILFYCCIIGIFSNMKKEQRSQKN